MQQSIFENRLFLVLLALISVAFIWLIMPFYGAIFWGAMLAILFAPVQAWIKNLFGGRGGWAALITLLLIVMIVILPVVFLTGALVQEGAALYQRISSGEQNYGVYLAKILEILPESVREFILNSDLIHGASMQETLNQGLKQVSQFLATQALVVGQGTVSFTISFVIMLYLLFFLLRDGAELMEKIKRAIPLGADYRDKFLTKFGTVVKATIKGNILIAALQGFLGGIMFAILDVRGALLWGFIMAILSLLPAVGASLIWAPVAIYFLVTGDIWQGVVLISFGIIVIGLVDSLLRPVLVGRDTKMPDYLILISTLGGMSLLGLSGFVIGPLIAALFMVAWSLFSLQRNSI